MESIAFYHAISLDYKKNNNWKAGEMGKISPQVEMTKKLIIQDDSANLRYGWAA
jgi:hypothetical protein